MENANFLNGKQYPYGFREWLMIVCIQLKMKDRAITTAYKKLDTDAWLVYFMDGLSPIEAVREDLKNA